MSSDKQGTLISTKAAPACTKCPKLGTSDAQLARCSAFKKIKLNTAIAHRPIDSTVSLIEVRLLLGIAKMAKSPFMRMTADQLPHSHAAERIHLIAVPYVAMHNIHKRSIGG